ncbi:MAG TPA: methyltransferase [Kiritimatiellia bacterium]|nr:methyltransferase [Kiritimatiellia bacterium]
MIRPGLFLALSVFFAYVSRRSLVRPSTHGFFRFFVWEALAALFLLNGPHWIDDPFGPRQLLSWTLITVSAALALAGAHALRAYGQAGPQRNAPELYAFERTSRLVTRGIYRYLRHPLYSSLLFLAWGVFLKQPGAAGFALAAATSLFLILTARRDEAECRSYFGAAYDAYAARTPGFLPFGP